MNTVNDTPLTTLKLNKVKDMATFNKMIELNLVKDDELYLVSEELLVEDSVSQLN